jgi:esterase/lipase
MIFFYCLIHHHDWHAFSMTASFSAFYRTLTRTWAIALLMSVTTLSPAHAAEIVSFSSYQQQTRDLIATQRLFQTDIPAEEINWNSPTEWRPATPTKKGVILVHGLGDSPWSLVDIGKQLSAQGYLVRSILLTGHGTKPADLINADINEWRTTLSQQVAALRTEVEHIYLGGFSTGANLVTSYAIDHQDIAGLVLFSPAFQVKEPSTWLLPIITPFRTWIRAPADGIPQQTAVRYLNTPTNGFLQFYRSSTDVQDKLSRSGFDRPALLVLTEHDSVVDVHSVLNTFVTTFTHQESRLIWYGNAPHEDKMDERVLVEPDYLPEERISQFSHMGILFSPDNPLYGRSGKERLCRNGQEEDIYIQCLIAANDDLWYSDWGYREANRIHARLTFNPYFEWQSELMQTVLESASQ